MNRETLITILNRRKKGGTGKQDVVRPSKRSKYLARRLNSRYINFYDLGQINTGTAESPTWTTNPYTKVPTVTFTGDTLTNIEHFNISDQEAFEDTLFDVPLADWSNTYRRLTYENAELYGLDVVALNSVSGDVVSEAEYAPIARAAVHRQKLALYNNSTASVLLESPVVGANTKWTTRGLKPFPSGQKIFTPLQGSMGVSVASWCAEANDTGQFIFTGVTGLTNSHGDVVTEGSIRISTTRGVIPTQPVPFGWDTIDASKAMNVYLMPEIFLEYSAHIDGSFNWHYLNFIYAIPDRDLWNSQLISAIGADGDNFLFENPSSARKATFASFVDPLSTAAAWTYLKGHPDARYYKTDSVAHTVSSPAASTYPEESGVVYNAQQRGFQPATNLLGVVFPWTSDPITALSWDTRDMTRLIMVVNQGNNWFYYYSSELQFSTGLSFQVSD